jgi:anti-anti-sigma factor
VAWVQVAGELDIATAPALEQTLRDGELQTRLVVLDLRELTFTDSCGARVISEAGKRAERDGRRLVLVRGPTQADRMFTLMKSDVLEIVDLEPGEPLDQALGQIAERTSQGRGLDTPTPGAELKVAISAAMVELHSAFYGHDHMTATTHFNDKIVVCVLENTLIEGDESTAPDGAGGEPIDARVAFQADTEDEFCAAIERLTHRRVLAFTSQDQTTPGVARELFFLDAAPLAQAESRA